MCAKMRQRCKKDATKLRHAAGEKNRAQRDNPAEVMDMANFQPAPYQGGYMQPYPTRMPYYQPQPMPGQAQNVVATMVTSRAEAEAAQISFDATLYLFVNLQQGEIYAKRFNPATGGADFAVFTAPRPAQQDAAPAYYATLDMLQPILQRLEACEQQLTEGKKTGKEATK